MTTITNAQALAKIIGFADEVPAEWKDDFAAAVRYLNENPAATMTHRITEVDVIALTEMHTGRKIDRELAQCLVDNFFA